MRWRDQPVGAEQRLHFGYLPEERGLYPKMRVRDEVVYLGRLHGMSKAEAGAATDRWLERLGLTDRAGDKVDSLSLGNQQRVQLAAALVHAPDLLVLDEPFSGLDPVAVDTLAGVLAEQVDAGVSVIFSSHQLDLVEDLCDSVAVIDHGRLVLAGRVSELKRKGGRVLRVMLANTKDPDWAAGVRGAAVEGTDARGTRLALDPGSDPMAVLAQVQACGDVLLIYLALLSYGSMISQGIAEEKSTRVSEVLLGAMRPYQLLAGKIAGIGVVGVLQLLAVGVAAGGSALALGSLHVPKGTPFTFAAVLMWFVLGFALYSCAYAAAGATASRPQEAAAAAAAPITFLLAASYGAAFTSLGDPNSGVVRVFSLIPLLTPMTMLPRAAAGNVAPWELGLSVLMVMLLTYALVRLAGRIYAGAIVRTGPRVKLREAWRAAAVHG